MQDNIIIDKLPLYNYQKRCISFIRRHRGRAILALDMGLGKTLTALAYSQYYKSILIVCPASVKYQWAQEIEQWFGPQKINILIGKKHKNKIITSKYYIINYNILTSWTKELIKLNPDIIILDECHHLRSSTSQCTQAMVKIARKTDYILGLSGTPMTSKPIDLYSVLNIINKSIFKNKRNFGHRYCYRYSYYDPRGYDYDGAQNLEELSSILTNKVMFRRRKEDVLKDLPPVIFTAIPLQIDLSDYNLAKKDTVKWLKDNNIDKDKVLAINKIEYLKQISAEAKISHIIPWIDDFLKSDKKLVLFAVHKTIIHMLMDIYKDTAVRIDGSTLLSTRGGIIEQFNTDNKTKILIGNIKAMGTGINGIQNNCSDVVFLELPWTPAELEQAYSRLHRIGQKNTVNVTFFLANNTIDLDIFNVISNKTDLTDTVIEGGNTIKGDIIKKLMKNVGAN